MENASAKLNPRELFQLKWLLGGLLALISMGSVLTLALGAELLVGVAMTAIGATLLFPKLPGCIPRSIWKVLPGFLLLVILGDFFLSGVDFIPPLVRAIVLLLTFRALEYRSRRHDLQLVLLGLFVVVVTGVLSMELSFALQVLLFTPVAMLVLFTATLSETASPHAMDIPEDPWRRFRWSTFLRRMRQVVDRRLLAFGGVLFAGMAASASLMFVLLPRFELGQALPFLRLQAQQSLSGFNETVSFGDVVSIIQDDQVALRVDIFGDRPAEVPYWRMLALDAYDGRAFSVSESAREMNRKFSDYLLEVNHNGLLPDSEERWTVYFESGVARFLPLPGQFASIRFQSRQDLVYNAWLHTLGLREVPGSVLFYQMEQLVQTDRLPATNADQALIVRNPEAAGLTGSSAAWRYPATTLAVPEDAATLTILDEVNNAIMGEDSLSAEAFATRATAWLRERHDYSLSTRIPDGAGNVLARWMVSEGGGHCELFAGSFVLLARQAGFPARLVTGFHGGDWNGFENYFMVRNAHAHAWVELFDGRGHWLRVDPTPGSGRPGVAATEDPTRNQSVEARNERSFEAYLDSLRILWYRRIVNFDQRQQRDLVAGLRGTVQKMWDGLREAFKGSVRFLRDLLSGNGAWLLIEGASVRILAGLILIALGALLSWILIKQRLQLSARGNRIRRRAGKWLQRLETGSGGDPEKARIYRELLTLRYDAPENWPEAEAVFRTAARLARNRGGERRNDKG